MSFTTMVMQRKGCWILNKHRSILEKLELPLKNFIFTEQAADVADHVCTVSESYAIEVQDREGNGLQKTMRLAASRGVFTGVTNGCNLCLLSPETDKQLAEWIISPHKNLNTS